jgi:hypothetical protein
LSIKILADIPVVVLFDKVIPIIIVSKAVEPPPAGTVYIAARDVPTSGVQILLKSLAMSFILYYYLCLYL